MGMICCSKGHFPQAASSEVVKQLLRAASQDIRWVSALADLASAMPEDSHRVNAVLGTALQLQKRIDL